MKSLELPKETNQSKTDRKKYGSFGQLFIGKERAYLFDDLAMMVKSGISVQSGLSLIRKNTKQKYYRQVITQILDSVDEGKTLWQSIDQAGIFSAYSVSLIRVGEESGRLAENLELIAKHEEKQRVLNSKLKSAISYPLFVFGLTLFIAIGAVWFIFPKLSTVFHSLNVKLPLITRVMIDIGDVMRTRGLLVVSVLVIGLIALYVVLFVLKPTKKYGEILLLSIPGVGTIIRQIEIERFGFLLGTLLDAGLPINSALDSLKRACRVHAYQKMYGSIASDIDSGLSLELSMAKVPGINRLIPQPVLEMIASGERSGRLPVVLQEIGDRYTKKTEASTENLTQMLEPFLLVFVWLGVVVIALAVVVPIYSLVGNLNG